LLLFIMLVDQNRRSSYLSSRGQGAAMPEKKTLERARKAKRRGKAPSTQAGEFVRETLDHIREGDYGARSTKQAIAIGLSKARRAGVRLPPPKKGQVSAETRRAAQRDTKTGQSGAVKKANPRRSRSSTQALRREGKKAASKAALSRQAKEQARKRTPSQRSAIAKKAARTRARRKGSPSRRVKRGVAGQGTVKRFKRAGG
jgi:hypothetical protein